MKRRADEEPGFLLFSGSNDRAVLALCRAFRRYGSCFALIGRRPDDLLRSSHYGSAYVYTRRSESLTREDLTAALDAARQRFGRERWVICPTSEYLILRLIDWRQALQQDGVELAIGPTELYVGLSHKARFRRFCERSGLSLPPLLDGDPVTLPLPFVAKPATNLSTDGRILYPQLLRTEAQRREYLTGCKAADVWYHERFLRGESYYLLAYHDREGRVRRGLQRNLLQQGGGKSIVLAEAADRTIFPGETVWTRALCEAGYRGFIMLEFRRQAGEDFMIEANPRCWGPLQLTLDAGMGLVEAFIRDWGGRAPEPPPPSQCPTATYLWFGGMVQALRRRMGLECIASPRRIVRTLIRSWSGDIFGRRDSGHCFLRELG